MTMKKKEKKQIYKFIIMFAMIFSKKKIKKLTFSMGIHSCNRRLETLFYRPLEELQSTYKI